MKGPQIAVGVMIRNPLGEYLFASMPKWGGRWCVVGGKPRTGESLEDCARRETLEETGIELQDIRFLEVIESIGSSEFHEPVHWVFINYLGTAASSAVRTNQEIAEWRWATPQAALASLELNSSTRQLAERIQYNQEDLS